MAQDGQRFLIIKEDGGDDDTSAQPQIIVVLNWFEELGGWCRRSKLGRGAREGWGADSGLRLIADTRQWTI